MYFYNLRRLMLAIATCSVIGIASASVSADPITITSGNAGGNGSTDNVLFNDGSLQHSGTFVQGNFSGSGLGYVVRFTSSSGNGMIEGSGGQATLTGLAGNNPFTSLTFGLEGGATFTNAILNIDSNSNGSLRFDVTYIGAGGGVFTQSVTVDANGQNFFHIDAGMGASIVSITYTGLDGVGFPDSNQFRLGGFVQTAPVPEPASMLLL